MKNRGIPQQPTVLPMPPTATQKRIRNIHGSITVAMDKGMFIPNEWIDEYNKMVERENT